MVVTATEPYRPSPWEEACNFHYWADDNPLAAPNTTGIGYTRDMKSENKRARIDLSPDLAWPNKRFWGCPLVKPRFGNNCFLPRFLTLSPLSLCFPI